MSSAPSAASSRSGPSNARSTFRPPAPYRALAGSPASPGPPRLRGPVLADAEILLALLQEPCIGLLHAGFQRDRRGPAEPGEPADIHQLARRTVGLRGV